MPVAVSEVNLIFILPQLLPLCAGTHLHLYSAIMSAINTELEGTTSHNQ